MELGALNGDRGGVLRGEIPSFKFQASRKFQASSFNESSLAFWMVGLEAFLEFGTWNLEIFPFRPPFQTHRHPLWSKPRWKPKPNCWRAAGRVTPTRGTSCLIGTTRRRGASFSNLPRTSPAKTWKKSARKLSFRSPAPHRK